MRLALLAGLLLTATACSVGTSPQSASPGDAAGPSADPGRGRLLYEMACQECHTTQAHWRDNRVVRSWGDLVFQVTRWQQIAGQNWSAQEVSDTAAYLNRRFYGLACPTPGCMGPTADLEPSPLSALAAYGAAAAPTRTGTLPPTPTR